MKRLQRAVTDFTSGILRAILATAVDVVTFLLSRTWWQWLLMLVAPLFGISIIASRSFLLILAQGTGNLAIGVINFVWVDLFEVTIPLFEYTAGYYNELIELIYEFFRSLLFDYMCPEGIGLNCVGMSQFLRFSEVTTRIFEEFINFGIVTLLSIRVAVENLVCNGEILVEGASALGCLVSETETTILKLLNDPAYIYITETGSIEVARAVAFWFVNAMEVVIYFFEGYVYAIVLFFVALLLLVAQYVIIVVVTASLMLWNVLFAALWATFGIANNQEDAVALEAWKNGSRTNLTTWKEFSLFEFSEEFLSSYDPVDLLRPDPETGWVVPGDPEFVALEVTTLEGIQDMFDFVLDNFVTFMTWVDTTICMWLPWHLMDCVLSTGFCDLLFDTNHGLVSASILAVIGSSPFFGIVGDLFEPWVLGSESWCSDLIEELGGVSENCVCFACYDPSPEAQTANSIFSTANLPGVTCLVASDENCCLRAGYYKTFNAYCFYRVYSDYTSIFHYIFGVMPGISDSPDRPSRCTLWEAMFIAPAFWANTVEDVYGFGVNGIFTSYHPRLRTLQDRNTFGWARENIPGTGPMWPPTVSCQIDPLQCFDATIALMEDLDSYPEAVFLVDDVYDLRYHIEENEREFQWCTRANVPYNFGEGRSPRAYSTDDVEAKYMVMPHEACLGYLWAATTCFSDGYARYYSPTFPIRQADPNDADLLAINHAYCPDSVQYLKNLQRGGDRVDIDNHCLFFASLFYEIQSNSWKRSIKTAFQFAGKTNMYNGYATYWKYMDAYILLDAIESNNFTTICYLYGLTDYISVNCEDDFAAIAATIDSQVLGTSIHADEDLWPASTKRLTLGVANLSVPIGAPPWYTHTFEAINHPHKHLTAEVRYKSLYWNDNSNYPLTVPAEDLGDIKANFYHPNVLANGLGGNYPSHTPTLSFFFGSAAGEIDYFREELLSKNSDSESINDLASFFIEKDATRNQEIQHKDNPECDGFHHQQHLTVHSLVLEAYRYGLLGSAVQLAVLQLYFGTSGGDIGPMCKFGTFSGTDCGSGMTWGTDLRKAFYYAWASGSPPHKLTKLIYEDLKDEARYLFFDEGEFYYTVSSLSAAMQEIQGFPDTTPVHTEYQAAYASMMTTFSEHIKDNGFIPDVFEAVSANLTDFTAAAYETFTVCNEHQFLPKYLCLAYRKAITDNMPFRACVLNPYVDQNDCLRMYFEIYHSSGYGAGILADIDSFEFVGKALSPQGMNF